MEGVWELGTGTGEALQMAKGQINSIDFMFALFLFLFMVAWLLSIWTGNLGVALAEQAFGEMREKSFQIADVLVRTQGTPENWEELGVYETDAIGLAVKDRVVDAEKVSAFVEAGHSAADYNRTKEIFGIVPFDYYFELHGVEDLETGVAAREGETAVSTERTVMYKGGEATVRITIHGEV